MGFLRGLTKPADSRLTPTTPSNMKLASGYCPLRRLVIFAHGGTQLVLTLRAYFDESGHSDDPGISYVSMGGGIATLKSWERCETEWAEVLRQFDVRQLHMRDFAHSRDEFSDWTEERRREFLSRLMLIIDRDVMNYVAAAVRPAAINDLPKQERTSLGDVYWGCLAYCVRSVATFAEGFPSEEKVEIVFSEQPEFGGRALEVYYNCKAILSNGHRLGAAAFASPSDVPALQVADLIAYEFRHYLANQITRGPDNYRWPLRQLLKKDPRFLGIVELPGEAAP